MNNMMLQNLRIVGKGLPQGTRDHVGLLVPGLPVCRRALWKSTLLKRYLSSSAALTGCWNLTWSQSGRMAPVALLTIIRRAPKWSYSEDSFLLTWIALLCAPLVAQLLKNLPMWETWLQSLGWEDPLEKGKATHSSIQT